ncbi:nucleotidyltransferase domain-containing protein [Candidatus Babeliales bacterium]|nr:nucleotidyltransferase domain-containing protein [Candidatus Babeliales bacterium]
MDITQYQFIKKIKTLPFVERVILFGSRAKKTNRKMSDFDIAVVCPHATILEWNQILEIVENADTLIPIDCIRFDQATKDLQEQIIKHGISL